MTAPRYFETPEDFRAWLDKNHATEKELLVGFYKVDSGRPSMTWPQSVDEALCYGWIDGIRRRIDDCAYSIRFTPRKPTSIWSAVNVKRVATLTKEGRMRPAGNAAFEKCDKKKSAIYSYERGHAEIAGAELAALKKNKKAWAFYSAQAPWYQRTTAHWVMSAKREETRAKRLAHLIDCSSRGERIAALRNDRSTSRPSSS